MSDLDLDNVVVVKVGSSVIAHESDIDLTAMQRIVNDIADIVLSKIAHVVLVTSGAVSIGKRRMGPDAVRIQKKGEASISQIAYTIGMSELISAYRNLFTTRGVHIAMGIITRRDFSIRERYVQTRDALLSLLWMGHVPILNDNDLVDQGQRGFSNNDHLAAYAAAQVNARRLVLLSDEDGLMDAPPSQNPKVITRVTNPVDARKYLWGKDRRDVSKLEPGAGGMPSKIDTAILMNEFGIPMHLANGRKPGVLKRILNNEPEGTIFADEEQGGREFTSIQRWLRAGAEPVGKIHLSTVIADLLRHGKRSSLLSMGIEKVERPFRKGDVVEAFDESGVLLGRGVAEADSMDLKVADERILDGQQQSPTVIHWKKYLSLLQSPPLEQE
ncbi:MAG: glutamate 5-kinase [Candidatus Peribacteraceae bacterium]